MKLDLTSEDLKYGGITVGLFLPVALLGWPLAFRKRHSEELRDTLPLRCVAMHAAGWCFVIHDWINWHNSESACPVLAVLEMFAASTFFCTLLWKHHAFYVRHVADRADHRFTLTALAGCIAFVIIGVVRFFYDVFDHRCLRLDAAVAGVALVQLAAGVLLFHRVGRFPGAHSLLHFAIRFELAIALITVIIGFIKQWVMGGAATITMLSIMSIGFNASFLLYLSPFLPFCSDRTNDSFDSALLNDLHNTGGSIQSAALYDSTGNTARNVSSRGVAGPRSSNTNRIADHFQGRLERMLQRLIRKFKDSRSERTILSDLENNLASSNLPAKLLVNAREDGTDRTILHYAAAAGYATVVARLAEYSGNDLEQVADLNGFEPLHSAVIGHEAADLPSPNRTLSPEDVASMCSARAEIVKVLLKQGARVNVPTPDGRRPLHLAVQHSAALGNLANFVNPTPTATPTVMRAMGIASSFSRDSRTNTPRTGGGGGSRQLSASSSSTVPAHLLVVDALLAAGAKQDPAVPPCVAMDTSTPFQSMNDSERHDLEWHHVIHRLCPSKKTPLSLAIEADDAMLVALMLQYIIRQNPQLVTSASAAAVLGGVARRAGLTCGECNGASILHVALVCGARRVCELLLAPHDAAAALGGRQLSHEECARISTIVWPMLGCRLETAKGMNVFHAAALGGDPALANLLLVALTSPNTSLGALQPASAISTPMTKGVGAFPAVQSQVGTPRSAMIPPATPIVTSSATPSSSNGPYPGETMTGSLIIVPHTKGAIGWTEGEGRLERALRSKPWAEMQRKDKETFASNGVQTVTTLVRSVATAGGAASVGAAASLARRDAALKVLKHAGFISADRLARSYEARALDTEDLVTLVDQVRADALRRLQGNESRLESSRTQADSVVAATIALLQFHFARMQPLSVSREGPSSGPLRGRHRSESPRGRSPSRSAELPTRRKSSRGRGDGTKPSSNGTTSNAPRSPTSNCAPTNVWGVLLKMLDTKAFEFGAAYSDNAAALTPLEFAACRGHAEFCRLIAAIKEVSRQMVVGSPSPAFSPPSNTRAAQLTTFSASTGGDVTTPRQGTTDFTPETNPHAGGLLGSAPGELGMLPPPAQSSGSNLGRQDDLAEVSASWLPPSSDSRLQLLAEVPLLRQALTAGRAIGEQAAVLLREPPSPEEAGSLPLLGTAGVVAVPMDQLASPKVLPSRRGVRRVASEQQLREPQPATPPTSAAVATNGTGEPLELRGQNSLDRTAAGVDDDQPAAVAGDARPRSGTHGPQEAHAALPHHDDETTGDDPPSPSNLTMPAMPSRDAIDTAGSDSPTKRQSTEPGSPA